MTYSYKEAGIPNITSGGRKFEFQAVFMRPYQWNGAFYWDQQYSGSWNKGSGDSGFWGFGVFDASHCSAVYRNDIDTVQPPAMTVNYYIKAK